MSKVVQNPIAATEANRRGIEIVLKNVDWYSELSSVVLEKNDNERGLSGIRQELKIQVVKLYVLLLSYQIRSVCSYYRDRVLELLRDIASLDDWKADIKAIEEAELGVRHKIKTYAELKTASDLDKLVNHASTKEDKQCIQDLRITDPLDDKRRIEQTKGGLSRELYCWILENPEYQQWRDSDENRLLWIKGDPGKGKTMLLCGIIDELNQQPSRSGLVSYFFCQATDQNLNNATAVLRGLIFMLVRQQPSLVSHVRRRYDQAGGKLFEGANTWFALSDIFTTMLQDPALKGAYLVVDALDECVSDQQQLLDLIILASGTEARVKWIMSSRNEFRIEERLKHAEQKVELSLEVELNAQSIATAVKLYIEDKLQKLSDAKGYNEVTQERVRNYLLKNANNTFLWVALVCQNLEKHALLEACDMLEAFPKGLESLYGRITQQVLKKDGRYANLCKQILMVMMSVYRPITLRELGSMAEINQEFSDDVGYLTDAVALCGSFLTIREDTIYFVHQSAKDYLSKNEGAIFESRLKDIHQTMVSLSLQAMTKILRKNIYALPWTGLLSDDGIDMPSPDPLSAIRYSCVHWVDHLCKGSTVEAYLEDKGPVDVFLREHLLHWLEALGLLHQVSAGILSIVALKDLVAVSLPMFECPTKNKANHPRQNYREESFRNSSDAHRFVLYNRRPIEIAPLQVYSSALVCSPTQSLVRKTFHREIPSWIQNRPAVEDNWSPCLQTLEGHASTVESVAFSTDLMQIASGSGDRTIKVWDITTGACIQTLEGHTHTVCAVAFTADSRRIVSGSDDKTIKIWDLATGACHRTLRGHTDGVQNIALLENDQIASTSQDATIKIWDMETGSCLQTLKGHTDWVTSVAPLAGGLVASGGRDRTIKIWDVATGYCHETLEGHTGSVTSLVTLANGQLISGSGDKTVRLWDIATRTCIRVFEGHHYSVNTTAIMANGQLASASYDDTIKIWDMATGTCIRTLAGYHGSINSVVSLSNGQIASGSQDGKVKLWDTTMSASVESMNQHQGQIESIIFSSDGRQVATGATDGKIKIWDADTGACIQTLVGHTDYVLFVKFLTDGRLVSGSEDKRVKLWDVETGACVRTFEGHSDWIYSVAASADGRRIASGSYDKTVRIWDTATGQCARTLDGHRDWVRAVALSRDGQLVASGSFGGRIMIYNEASHSHRTLGDHGRDIASVAISPDGLYALSGADNNTIKVWHIATGKCVHKSDVHAEWGAQLSFDPTMNYRICSNLGGYIDLDPPSLEAKSEDGSEQVQSSRPPTPPLSSVMFRGYGIERRDGREEWIRKDGKPLFWLPPEYRSWYSAVSGSTVAVVVGRTRVAFFKFSEAGPES